MASAIDITKPIYGTPTTQSVRDNFHIASNEITALQDQSTSFVNRSGDTMTGLLTLSGSPVNAKHAATLEWTLQQLHSTINTLIYVGDYDGAADRILTSGQPQFVVGQPLPLPLPANSQYYFTVKTSSPGIGHQPPGGVVAGTWLISNGTNWSNFAMSAPGVIAQGVPVSPAIPNVPGTNVYDALTGIGTNFLLKSGGTLTGALMLYNVTPVAPSEAASKSYVDTRVGSVGGIAEAPNDGFGYARLSNAWSNQPTFTRIKIDTNGWNHITLNSTTASNSGNQITGMKDNRLRWVMYLGNNVAAQNFELYRFDDIGNTLDGVPSLSMDRTSGDLSIIHSLHIDPLVSAVASLYGRGANNPTNPSNDTLNIYARGGGLKTATIGLRGPLFTGNPNGIDLFCGPNNNFIWRFMADGSFITPGTVAISQNSWLAFGGGGTGILKDTNGNFIFYGNQDWRYYFGVSNGSWNWEGYPNLTSMMRLDNVGNLYTLGSVTARSLNYRNAAREEFDVEAEIDKLRQEIETLKGQLQ